MTARKFGSGFLAAPAAVYFFSSENSLLKSIKKIFLTIVIVTEFFSVAEGAAVTVEGTGTDRESALRDARRLAVEQVVGTFVDSRTLTKNFMVELDNVYTKSNGFVGKIDVLDERTENGLYIVRATIDVDRNPIPEILQQVQAVMALNDPRIAIIILKENSSVHEERIESAIADRLIAMNFKHIVDPNIVTALHDAPMLNALYNGRPITGIGSNFGADFIVLGKCNTNSHRVMMPDFKGGYTDLGLNNSKTEIVTKIIRPDTGDVLETFTLETSGMDGRDGEAENISLKNMAAQVAAKVEEKFRRIGARNSNGFQIIVVSDNYEKISELANDMRSITEIQSVYIREHRNGKAIIETDSHQDLETVLLLLRRTSTINFSVDSVTAGSAKLTLR